MRWKTAVPLLLAAGLAGCGPDSSDGSHCLFCFDPVPVSCGGVRWYVAASGVDTGDVGPGGVVQLAQGQSRRLTVFTDPLWTTCVVTSVAWSSSDPSAVSLEPSSSTSTWMTALAPGESRISAEVVLDTGDRRTAPLGVLGTSVNVVRVVPPPPPSPTRVVVAHGEVDLEPHADAHVPFSVPSVGTLDMAVDWGTPTTLLYAHVCPGEVLTSGCVPVIDGNRSHGLKPLVGTARVQAGTYTFWIANEGPAAERVVYEAGLTP